MGKWVVVYESKFPNRGILKCKCDKCEHIQYGQFRDFAYSNIIHYIMPNFCEDCGDKKENIYIEASE